MIEVENGIPIPEKPLRVSAYPKYPFTVMEVGSSFQFPYSKKNSVNARARYLQNEKWMSFTIMTTGEKGNRKCRIWRIK